ncbi:MAG: type II toxin-antitoxin system VapC family toxin [Cyanobacteria bacterium P01_H01_bin.105]
MKAGFVLDASALLAWLFNEPGKEQVSTALKKGCLINTVNWMEVVQKSIERGMSSTLVYERLKASYILDSALKITSFTETLSITAAGLIKQTKPFGLSLGDRACLAFGIERKQPILTADRIWADIEVPVSIQLIR